jgi:Peptide methionine sulfoxide reductase
MTARDALGRRCGCAPSSHRGGLSRAAIGRERLRGAWPSFRSSPRNIVPAGLRLPFDRLHRPCRVPVTSSLGAGHGGPAVWPGQQAFGNNLQHNFGGRTAMGKNTETAILAGGCFWPAQELLRHRDGVISTRVGYTGGENENPTAGNHPGHAEAVEVIFDPERTSTGTSWSSSSRPTGPTLAKELSVPIIAPRSSISATSSARSPRTRSPTPRTSGAPRS